MQQADLTQSSSQARLAATISDSNISALSAHLIKRYLLTDMSFSTYKTLACWLGVYRFDIQERGKIGDKVDREILSYLVNNTNLTSTQIYHKLIFLRDFNHGHKTETIKLLLSTHSPQLP